MKMGYLCICNIFESIRLSIFSICQLRQKQFKQGCELDRFHELMTHYNIEPTKENYREMSQLLTIDSDKIFHRDRTNAPHTTESEESFVHAMLDD